MRKSRPESRLRRFPVALPATAKAEQGIFLLCELGSSSLIAKPVTFVGLGDVTKALGAYRLEIVELPFDE